LLETQSCIGFHAWGLDEGLELITWVSRGTLNTKDSLDGLFTEDGVTETFSNVGELLVISPLNLELGALIVIVMVSSRAVLQGLSEVNFLGL
jgi:hypothetical protein